MEQIPLSFQSARELRGVLSRGFGSRPSDDLPGDAFGLSDLILHVASVMIDTLAHRFLFRPEVVAGKNNLLRVLLEYSFLKAVAQLIDLSLVLGFNEKVINAFDISSTFSSMT